jgi:hypothetical protein
MALEDMYDTIIARAVKVARRNSIMPRLVNSSTTAELTQKGGTANITVIDTVPTPTPITPGPVPPASTRPTPRNVSLAMPFWEDNTFNLTDRDITSMSNNADYIPKELEASAAGIADRVDQTILANYKGIYGFAGTAGTTPFATSTLEAQQATRVLSTQNCPKGQGENRAIVLNEFAYANAIGLDVLQRVDASGSNITLREAMVGRAMGFYWDEDQNVPRHITTATGTFTTSGTNNAGATTLTVTGGTTPPAFGDVFSIAGHTQTYSVLSVAGSVWTISPRLQSSPAGGSAITFRASHTVNLAFHEMAFAFASRPVAQLIPDNVQLRTFVDEVSGLVLTLEIAREYYRTAFRLSCMWGTELVQPRFATRIAGE